MLSCALSSSCWGLQAKQAAEAAEELVKEQDAEHQAAAAAQRAKQQRASKRARQRQRKQVITAISYSVMAAQAYGMTAEYSALVMSQNQLRMYVCAASPVSASCHGVLCSDVACSETEQPMPHGRPLQLLAQAPQEL